MKSISASIIVTAGMLGFGFGSMVTHSDTQIFVCGVGLVVAAIGLYGWFTSLRSSQSHTD